MLRRLVWLCMLPVVLLAAWLAYDSVTHQHESIEQEARHSVDDMARLLDARLSPRMRALEMLAQSAAFDDAARWADAHAQALDFHRVFGSHVILADAQGQMLFHTDRPFGTALPPLPKPPGVAAAPRALATGRPAVGDSFVGPVAGIPLIAIAVPLKRAGQPDRVLLAPTQTSRVQAWIDELNLPRHFRMSVQDSRGQVIARREPPDARASFEKTLSFRQPMADAPWTVVLEVDESRFVQPLVSAGLMLAAFVAAATMAGLLGGNAASRHLAAAVESLARPAAADDAPVPDSIEEIARARAKIDDASALREQALQALAEREASFQAMFASMPDAVVLADAERRIRLVNPAFTTKFGYGIDEIAGRTTEFLYADTADFVAAGERLRAGAAAADALPSEVRYRRKDGSEFWGESRLRRIQDDEGTHDRPARRAPRHHRAPAQRAQPCRAARAPGDGVPHQPDRHHRRRTVEGALHRPEPGAGVADRLAARGGDRAVRRRTGPVGR
ncbi:MAG: PAS domain S-box protein [Piscinibacter sp.]